MYRCNTIQYRHDFYFYMVIISQFVESVRKVINQLQTYIILTIELNIIALFFQKKTILLIHKTKW